MSYNPNTSQPNSPPSKHRKWLPLVIGITIAVAIIASVPVILALVNPSPVVVSASTAQSVFGGTWTVVTSETYFAKYPVNYITVEYANGTNVTIPYPHQVKSVDHEVLVGKVNNTSVTMIIQVITYTSNVTPFINHMFNAIPPNYNIGFYGGMLWGNNGFSFNVTTYNGYTIVYFSSTFPHPHTSVTAIKGDEVIQIRIIGISASLQQVEDLVSSL